MKKKPVELALCDRCKEPVPSSELVYVAEWTGPYGAVLFADGLRCGKCRPATHVSVVLAGEGGRHGG